jgi:hypothetical protein
VPALWDRSEPVPRLNELREGLVLSVYSDDADDSGARDDLITERVVRGNAGEGEWEWVLEIDEAAIRHQSDDRRK